MDKELLQSMLAQKLVMVQKHPDTDLFIYNYSPVVQYQKLWNEITLMTRGLILDQHQNIIARPFQKFFNLEEHSPDEIPSEPFDVFHKEDGSLGILYWIDDQPAIATRGSFASEQALHATKILRERYAHTFPYLNREHTYLFEIIYPENRIVVNYGELDDLILLAVIDTQTGKDLLLPEIGFPIVKQFDGINDLAELRAVEAENQEGFVIRFKSGFRVKVKFAEYVRLHRIITQTSSTVVWENLATGNPLEELLEKVPDEFYEWVKQTQADLLAQFDEILLEAKSNFKTFDSRKEAASYFFTQKYPHIMFRLLDGKDPSDLIWKMIKPQHSKPFKVEI
ncbi:MAG: RNA ligase [Snowella sp.]|nr:RNA ligase [Snowella sp.]